MAARVLPTGASVTNRRRERDLMKALSLLLVSSLVCLCREVRSRHDPPVPASQVAIVNLEGVTLGLAAGPLDDAHLLAASSRGDQQVVRNVCAMATDSTFHPNLQT
jgi:hypothetical protein